MRWKVGTEKEIRIWGTPWLQDDEWFQIRSPCPLGLENMQVHELIIENIWRSCHGCLPNRVNLFRNRVVDSKTCVLCEVYEETG